MIKFSQEKVLLLHQLITEETGGDHGLRDEALLNSALESAYATFDGKDLYPSKEEKAARLGFALISNHAFVDGNKRIGMYVMLTFLEVNGIPMACTNEEVARIGLAVADGSVQYDELLQWILENKAEQTTRLHYPSRSYTWAAFRVPTKDYTLEFVGSVRCV